MLFSCKVVVSSNDVQYIQNLAPAQHRRRVQLFMFCEYFVGWVSGCGCNRRCSLADFLLPFKRGYTNIYEPYIICFNNNAFVLFMIRLSNIFYYIAALQLDLFLTKALCGWLVAVLNTEITLQLQFSNL